MAQPMYDMLASLTLLYVVLLLFAAAVHWLESKDTRSEFDLHVDQALDIVREDQHERRIE